MIKPVRLLAVFAENKPDQLARVSGELAAARVNIHWVGIADVQKFGVIRFLVDQCDLAHTWLQRHGYTVSLVEILAVEVEDRPGSLHQVAQALAERQVSIANCSGFVFNHRATLLLEVADLPRARQILTDRGLRLLSEGELLTL